MRSHYIYILNNRRYGVLYVGATANLARRIAEHQQKLVAGFTSTRGLTRLVYFEEYPSVLEARARERSLKRWRRAWKIKLIDESNPDWRDLTKELTV